MKSTLTTRDNYRQKIFSIITKVAPIVGLMAGATFTIAKALGNYEETSWTGVIVFDVICCIYGVMCIIGSRAQYKEDGSFNNKAYALLKLTVTVVVAFQWNLVTYIFPTQDFWGYAPLFLIIVAFFYDVDLIVVEAIILMVSILVSWVIKGEILLPETGITFNANLILRAVCILISFFLIYIHAKISEKALEELAEQSDMLRRFTSEEKRIGKLVDVVSANDEKKVLDGMKILLVDDNELTRELDSDILREEGAAVTVAGSGEEAVSIFKRDNNFDAILIDLIMPGMSGIEATGEIRRLERNETGKIPIVGITGDRLDAQVESIIRAGATDCISKPLVVSEFARILISAMKENTMTVSMKLDEARHLANTDALTKVKNVTSYADKIAELTSKISQNKRAHFAIVMCDVDSLKQINDTYGHAAGDEYIKNCTKIICDTFVHSPVYRIGGDEFVSVLEETDYENREYLMNELIEKEGEARHKDDVYSGRAAFSFGIAVYNRKKHTMVSDVIKDADREMYKIKNLRHTVR